MANNLREGNLDELKKILCPVDFSDLAANSVRYAISFGSKFGLTPQILHVSTKPPDVYYRFFPDFAGYLTEVEKDIQSQMKDFISRINDKLSMTIRFGTVYQEIIQYAQEEGVDLIIIAAGGYSTAEPQTLGTVTQKAIRKADCPVLTVYGKRVEATINKILCPIDLSERSFQGLFEAASLARKFNAKIYMLHVIELHEFEKRKIKKYSSEEAFDQLTKVLKEEIKIPAELNDVEIETVIRRNVDAAAEIVYFASKHHIDLITLTTHGRGYLPRVLLGSVTEKVLHIAPCPVLTVRISKKSRHEGNPKQ